MPIDEEQLRRNVLQKLNQWVEALPEPDRPIIARADGSEMLSARQIVDEVDRGTPLGDEIVQNWIDLALNHVMKSQLLRK